MIHRLICFVCATTLLAVGICVVYLQLRLSRPSTGFFHIVQAGSNMATLGLCWLYEDFLEHWFRLPLSPPDRPRPHFAMQAANDNRP
jgi:hypothetical protein